MLYSKWSCLNYGPYYGENTIDLIGNIENKSIVLIRGLNGYGKTSFINGIRLALYGKNACLHNDTEYKHFLKERMNDKAMDEGQRNAYVSIEFIEDNKNSGFINKIQVKREWTLVTEDYASDDITIIRNGKELQINDDEIQEYLDKIIPKELLQFFAFDAEQIRYTTDDNNFNDSLANDIAKILDITKYEFAYEKLKVYIQKQKNASNKVTGSKVSEIDLNITQIKEQIEDLNEIIKQLEFEIQNLNQKLDRKQRWMDERGYSDNDDINKYETQRLKLEERRKVLIESLEQENFSIFPYAILLTDLKILKTELEDEVQISLRDKNKKFVEESLEEIVEIIEDKNIIPNLLESQIMQIKDYIDLRIKSQFNSESCTKNLIHLNELSQKELNYIMN